MSGNDPSLLGVTEASARIAAGTLTSTELVRACLVRIDKLEPTIRAWIALDGDAALAEAAQADVEIAAGRRRGPLHGIPFGVKDILFTRGFATTANSRLPLSYAPDAEADAVSSLRDAGAILLGKLNTYEFGTGNGAVYADLPTPPARNPWDPNRFTGGSSTGAGAAVAARMIPFAIGTDTGGSVRLPAAACGVVGLKPSYGRVSRAGMLLNCPSQDSVGPLARSAADTTLVMSVLTGADMGLVPSTPSGLRVAVVRDYHDGRVPGAPKAMPEMEAGFEAAVAALGASGADLLDRSSPYATPDIRACSRIINAAECHAIHHHRLDDPEDRIGAALRDKLVGASEIPAATYIDACRWRRAISKDLGTLFTDVDVVLSAGTLSTAPPISDERACQDLTTLSAMAGYNLSGAPAICLPVGLGADGLPLNVQLAAPFGKDAELLSAAGVLEAALVPMPIPAAPTMPPEALAPPPPLPDREGRAEMLRERMRETANRFPYPLPDDLESALEMGGLR